MNKTLKILLGAGFGIALLVYGINIIRYEWFVFGDGELSMGARDYLIALTGILGFTLGGWLFVSSIKGVIKK